MLQFIHWPHWIAFTLTMGPGTRGEFRKRMFDLAESHQPPFKVMHSFGPKHIILYWRTLWSEDSGEVLDMQALERDARDALEEFLEHRLPKVVDLMESAELLP
ncbi:MAG: hypothetical protein M3328_08900 [Chloroflexota bacterium]|nr:hypothetical protein [Chloroflexota bacterium]